MHRAFLFYFELKAEMLGHAFQVEFAFEQMRKICNGSTQRKKSIYEIHNFATLRGRNKKTSIIDYF